MRRLYLQIYLAIVAILLLFSVLATLAWFAVSDDPLDRATLTGLGELAGDVLPAPDHPQEAQLAALSRLASQLDADLALRAPDGSLVAEVGRLAREGHECLWRFQHD